MASAHSDELLAQELASYIEDTAQSLAAAIREGRHSPGSPSLARADVLAYYRFRFSGPAGLMAPTDALMTPDGARIGPMGIARVYKELAKAMPTPAPIPEGVTV